RARHRGGWRRTNRGGGAPAQYSPARQSTCTQDRYSFLYPPPPLERIVHTPHGQHSRRKVRVEVAVENRITNRFVPVATTVVDHLQRVARTRTDHLAVEI